MQSEVIVAEPVDEIGARPAHVPLLRLVAVTVKGERLIGEYTFNHTPWPGPAEALWAGVENYLRLAGNSGADRRVMPS